MMNLDGMLLGRFLVFGLSAFLITFLVFMTYFVVEGPSCQIVV